MNVGGGPHTPHRVITGSPRPSNGLRLRTPTRPRKAVALLGAGCPSASGTPPNAIGGKHS
jgi:hypothetical protein